MSTLHAPHFPEEAVRLRARLGRAAAFTPVSARQVSGAGGAPNGPIEYAYVDNLGGLKHARQLNPDDFASAQYTPISGMETFAGQPALAEQPDGRVQVAGHNIDADVWVRSQTEKGSPGWADWADQGGWLSSGPSAARMPDGPLVLFGVDADGHVWAKPQAGTNAPYGAWRDLGDVDLVGAPTVAVARNGVQLFGLDTAGVLRTATYTGSELAPVWMALSGPGMKGAPAVATYPGFRSRVFLRTADNRIVTRLQALNGSWPGDWQSTGAFAAAGTPAAILDPVLSRTVVLARGADSQIYALWETAPGSGAWGTWTKAVADHDPAASDPVVTPISNTAGAGFIVVFRSPADRVRVYDRGLNGAAAAVAATGYPLFNAGTLPAPPR